MEDTLAFELEDPLDFEVDDPFLRHPSPGRCKRRKAIGLDDLLTELYKEGSKLVEDHGQNLKEKKNYASDEDENMAQKNKERELSKFMDSCQKQVHEMATEEDSTPWGLQVFGRQMLPRDVDFSSTRSCKLIHSLAIETTLKDNKDIEEDFFLEGLLKNGWLLKLVFLSGYVEDCITSWTFSSMLYSSNEELHSSACEFWCSVFSSKQISMLLPKSNCFSFLDLKSALEAYGYLSGHFVFTAVTNRAETDHQGIGPPSNIRSWLKFVSSLCKSRDSHTILLCKDVEELLSIIISLFLERRLQGFACLLDECLRSIVSCFSDEEWCTSCENIATTVAARIPRDLNCVHIVESVSLFNLRCKNLRSRLAFRVIIQLFDNKVIGAKDVVKFLLSINLKDKNCDFFKVYIYLVLVENWLCLDHQVKEKQIILEMWLKFLRNCSTQITSTDWRTYASKVRNRASYLMQSES